MIEPGPVPESFPRLAARTMNFRLGLPRAFVVSPDGRRVVFLRSMSGTSRAHALWVYDVDQHTERLVADPSTLLGVDDETLTAQERMRRERLRVTTSGVVAYSTDSDVTVAAFALSSRLFVADLLGDDPPREVPTSAPVVDPRLDPAGRRVAYAGDRSLRMVILDDGSDELVVGPEAHDPAVVFWGLAEFIAGEELDRGRGFWWAPDGGCLLVERCDESPVQVWHISDPAHPEREPIPMRYPRAGTANASIGLAVVTPGGRRVDVDWRSDAELDAQVLEYLVHVEWSRDQPLLTLLTRDQRRLEYRQLDPATGVTRLLRAVIDDAWVELLPGTPRLLDDGRLLHSVDHGDERRIWIDDEPVTPPHLLIRSVVAVEDAGNDKISVIAEIVPEVGSVALARLRLDKTSVDGTGVDGTGLDGMRVELLSDPLGVAGGAGGAGAGGTLVVSQQLPSTLDVVTTVSRHGAPAGTIDAFAETSPLVPTIETIQVGSLDFPTTVLFPSWHTRGSRRLPVLMDPYGGPHGQRVINAARPHLMSQWFAEQGFVVIVADGRGTAGRGPAWDRLAKNDRLGTIDDQVEVLSAVAELFGDDVDVSRVAIRGWSFGGYVAALGVLRHPEVFAAAIAGAPTTDERLYDTCYSERYLGHPDTADDVYEANSLIPLAPNLTRPLMIIHGLADDNVYVAHSLRLSSALLAAGKPHEVLPLSGMTHLADDEVVAENLLLLQVEFLRRSLRIDG